MTLHDLDILLHAIWSCNETSYTELTAARRILSAAVCSPGNKSGDMHHVIHVEDGFRQIEAVK